MKFSGFQKYFLLLMLSLGIVQGSYACFSFSNADVSKKSTYFHSKESQLLNSNFLFDLVEENDDYNDIHFSIDFVTPSNNNFTFPNLQYETFLTQNFLSSPPFYNQKINILNCTFLI